MQYKDFLQAILTQASHIAMVHFGKVTASVKLDDNNQVLTIADTEIGQYLVAACQTHYPDFNVIDEETGIINKQSNYTWVIDPIDGTSNFANSLPHFGIMAGLLKGATPIAGGIVLPALSQLYIAEKGKGATKNGDFITVSSEDKLSDALAAYGIDGHHESSDFTRREGALLAEIVLKIRNLRTSNSAFDIAAVADGRYGASLNQTSKIWDNVAPQVIIEEAGGIYTDFWGDAIDYRNPLDKSEQNFTLCAGAPELHAQLQKIIHASS